jgi:hypothetical protein
MAQIIPRGPARFTPDSSPGSAFDLCGPSGFDFSRFLRTGLKALQKFDGDARSAVWCQLQGHVEHFSYLGHVLNFTTVAAGA